MRHIYDSPSCETLDCLPEGVLCVSTERWGEEELSGSGNAEPIGGGEDYLWIPSDHYPMMIDFDIE